MTAGIGFGMLTSNLFCHRCIWVENVEGPNKLPEFNHPIALENKESKYEQNLQFSWHQVFLEKLPYGANQLMIK
jgi:hypothetical protein